MPEYIEASHEGIDLHECMFDQPKNANLWNHVCWLSDGTLASLTGINKHETLDKILSAFREFVSDKDDLNWESAWDDFWTVEEQAKWQA